MQKVREWECSSWKREKSRGYGKNRPLFFLPSLENRGGGRRADGGLGRRPCGLVGVWEVGERERESRWVVSPFLIWTEVERGGWHTAAGGGDRGGGTARLGGGPELGEKGKGTKRVLSLTLVRAGA